MAKGIDAEARQARHLVGKVETITRLEVLAHFVGHSFSQERRSFVSAQLAVFDRNEVPIQTDAWWLARQQVQIRAFLVDHKFEKSVDTLHVSPWRAHAPTRLILGNRCGSVTKR